MTPSLFCDHLPVCSETFPTSGTMRNGKVYAPQTWAPHTTGTGSSSTPHGEYLPTPLTTDNRSASAGDLRRNAPGLRAIGSFLPTPRATRGGSSTETMYLLGAEVDHSDRTQGEVVFPTPRASDGYKGGPNQRGSKGDLTLPATAVLLQTPSVADAEGSHERRGGARNDELLLPGQAKEMRTGWGPYEPSIRRWEAATGTPAPTPTVPNSRGRERLNPAFVEWMMGVSAGWITDVDISVNDQIKACGNGVVPQQALEALRRMAARRAALHGE